MLKSKWWCWWKDDDDDVVDDDDADDDDDDDDDDVSRRLLQTSPWRARQNDDDDDHDEVDEDDIDDDDGYEEDDVGDDVDDVDEVDDAETASVTKHVCAVSSWKWAFGVGGAHFPKNKIWVIFGNSTLHTSAAVCTVVFFQLEKRPRFSYLEISWTSATVYGFAGANKGTCGNMFYGHRACSKATDHDLCPQNMSYGQRNDL